MTAFEVSHLTKEYRLGALVGAKHAAMNLGRRLLGKTLLSRALFRALEDVSFSIEHGEVVGIIGHNGAGKSTVLKMLARFSPPPSGHLKVDGRIAPLIEVGAGFVPDFTGRENVYLNCSILGMSRRKIDAKFDEIVDFAEIREFIDTPVKRYSSGMQVKLGFAVATSIEAEILIVDEVLAVGDLAFQRKCFDRMEHLIKRQGRTVLLVSHNIRQVARMCGRVILMRCGKIMRDGAPDDVCDAFYEENNRKIVEQKASRELDGRVFGSGEVSLQHILLMDQDGNETKEVVTGASCKIRCLFSVQHQLTDIEIVYGLHTTDFVYISSINTARTDRSINLSKGEHVVDCLIDNLPLEPGVYAIRVAIFDKLLTKIFFGETLLVFSVRPQDTLSSKVSLQGLVNIPAHWELRLKSTT